MQLAKTTPRRESSSRVHPTGRNSARALPPGASSGGSGTLQRSRGVSRSLSGARSNWYVCRMRMESPDRVGYIDVARALGLMAIVLYHARPPDRVAGVLLSYAIGLFFVISGFVYKEAYSAHPIRYTWKRFKRLYIPFVGWGLFYLAIHNLLFRSGLYSGLAGFQGRTSSLVRQCRLR